MTVFSSYPEGVDALALADEIENAAALETVGKKWRRLPVGSPKLIVAALRSYGATQESSDGCFDMLWRWFTERRGVDDMRANAADGGLSAEDFKQMLDEHELNIMPPQSASVAQRPNDPLVTEDFTLPCDVDILSPTATLRNPNIRVLKGCKLSTLIRDLEEIKSATPGPSLPSTYCECPVGMHSIGCKNR